MRIMKHPLTGEYWWYFCPTTIAARIRALFSDDRLSVIWVRPLHKDEAKQVERMLNSMRLPNGYSVIDRSAQVGQLTEAAA